MMKELIEKFKEIYEYASWESREQNSVPTPKKPFALCMSNISAYKRTGRNFVLGGNDAGHYTLVDDLVDVADETKKFRVTVTPHYSPRSASEGMLLRLVASTPFVRMGKGNVSGTDICFCDKPENPRILIFLIEVTVVSVRLLSNTCATEDLYKLVSVVASQIRK
ncbi:hypothetical protein [uncultured Bacteroides sp.]|uniref:hypothetical protein n=1 Tax=uncultured Bacteroides sp. TaxID=162156 RepID=UPI002AA85503|nr:hypothetical protein [uncultured Bacteroides sp.]